MRLKELLNDIEPVEIIGNLDLEIKEIVYDSRQVKKDSLFICIEGLKDDGHKYITKAHHNGAVAVVIEKKLKSYEPDLTYIRVDNSRKAMSFLAATFYNYPLKKLNLIGVTGTNGKTTTTYLVKSVLEKAGIKTGLIGTIKNIIGDETLPSTRTTPESLDLYRLFANMVENGITHVVMEVSSHALSMKRVMGMEFKVAIFTNISQDHLDYHKSLEDYLKAKSILFSQIEENGYAVINLDDKYSQKIIEATNGEIITYAIEKDGDYKVDEHTVSPRGISFKLAGKDEHYFDLNLTGYFNIYNALAAIATGKVLGIEINTIKEGLEEIEGVAGRFEKVDLGQEFTVVVDYAHTPDGMENVLKTAQSFVKGKIISVFGCGGDRDQGKRPIMGKIGAQYSDYCVLTSDNPRSEDPQKILNQIEAGIKELDNTPSYEIINDRKKAIYRAIELAKDNDMILIFGKGHETYQIFKDKTVPFDDREVAREAIKEKLKGEKG